MEVSYTPGRGVLVARPRRWLLLGLDDPATAQAALDQLWTDLDQPAGFALALATLQRHLAGTPYAWLDAGTGEHGAEGGGTVTSHGDRWELAVAGPGPAPTLRLVEGIVAASALHATGHLPAPGDVAAPTGLLIDGIPPEILAAPRPARPAAYDAAAERPEPEPQPQPEPEPQPVESRTVRRAAPAPTTPPSGVADTDHDSHTRMRTGAAPGAAPPVGHLEQSTSDTVLAVRCEQGHLTDPLLATCRACGRSVPPQEPARVLRPPLGVLRLPDGEPVLLDRPVVLGRRPAPSGPGDWPHLVRLPHDSTYLSRLHLRIDLDGWHVLAQDLGSRGGTTLFAPGRDPEKIRGHEPHLLESGTTLDLAGAYQVTYHSTVEETS